jgi:protein-S-isoprenylcysteine O-methyltransferase Ste14
MPRLLVQAAIFILIAPGAVTIGMPWLIVRLANEGLAPAAFRGIAITVMAIGLAGFAWCVYDFLMRGRGTPAPYEAPTELVVTGLYRLSRNPMYASLLVVLIGEALLFASPWLAAWAAIVFLAFHLRVVIYEEPTLADTFGASWHDYRDRTPRWLPHPWQ